MAYKVKQLARVAGVTVRTLHHYDAIGLLRAARNDAGYRVYDAEHLVRLQQICTARELGLSLEEIRRMLDDPAFDRRGAMLSRRRQLQEMLRAIDAGLERDMYEREAAERWGATDAYKEAAKRTKGYTKQQVAEMKAESEALMASMAERMQAGDEAGGKASRDLAEQHRLHIDRWFYPCSHRMHAALADMYIADDRFRATFDAHGEGLAAYFAAAIHAYTKDRSA